MSARLQNQGSITLALYMEDGILHMEGEGWATPDAVTALIGHAANDPPCTICLRSVDYVRGTAHGSFHVKVKMSRILTRP